MLTPEEEEYLTKLSDTELVDVQPYDPKVGEIAGELIRKVSEKSPDLEVVFIGASALKISGQNDIDIYCLASPKNFEKYLPAIKNLFGEPSSTSQDSIAWKMERDGLDVELYLTNPESPSMARQLKVFQLLKDNPQLLAEYQQLKLQANGHSVRDYQRQKYEFYNKILQ